MAYRIMIVDDSPAMRALIRRVIGLSGFEVDEFREAANGVEALEGLHQWPVDAVLTDINMPLMDGEELLERMVADETLGTIPVLVISTDGTARRMERMLSLGARAYVTKPFMPEVLRAELDRSLGVADA